MALDTIDLIEAVPGNAAPLVDQFLVADQLSADFGYRPLQPTLRLLVVEHPDAELVLTQELPDVF